MTTEQWIERAKKVHGDKYDYSKTNYIDSKNKVCIICSEHGEFWQEANSHLKGCGCRDCAIEKHRYNNVNTFIKEAKKIHGNKYIYKDIFFNSKNDKINIICRKHGAFTTTPHIHLLGCDCPICVGNVKLTTEQFIERAKKIHGNKYDYHNVVYFNNRKKIKIICHEKDENGIEHGEFEQSPDSHLQGQGCPKCAGVKKMNVVEFIEKARNVHGDKYDYSKVEYVNNKTNVKIVCNRCGYEFLMKPNSHLQGQGCRKCGYKELGVSRRLTLEQFIEKARNVHGDKYDYSKVEYINYDTPICIICHEKDENGIEHGEFWQTPHRHLKGHGCSKCRDYHLEREIRFLLDENNIKYIFRASKKDGFDWLGRQSLDFYLPDYNIAIECQGLQHFEPVDFAGRGKEWAKKLFEDNKKRDFFKKQLCKSKNIEILYYSDKNFKGVFNDKMKLLLCITKKKILKNF